MSYDADPTTGVAVYDSYGTSGWLEFGGTSAPVRRSGQPCLPSLTRVARSPKLAPLGNTASDLYSLPSSDFHDITSGSNGYKAGPGYDLASGLGSPIANKIIAALIVDLHLDGQGRRGPRAEWRDRQREPSNGKKRGRYFGSRFSECAAGFRRRGGRIFRGRRRLVHQHPGDQRVRMQDAYDAAYAAHFAPGGVFGWMADLGVGYQSADPRAGDNLADSSVAPCETLSAGDPSSALAGEPAWAEWLPAESAASGINAAGGASRNFEAAAISMSPAGSSRRRVFG